MRPRSSHKLHGPACSLCDIIHFGYFHQISLLVSKGIDINTRDSFGRTPLILCAFMQPEEWGVGTAMMLIEQGVYLGDKDLFGRNVLHYACIYERQLLVPVLLRAVDFDLNQADTLGNTALHYAAMSGNVAITNLLVQSYRKYRIKVSKVNRKGKTALEEALMSGNAACARVIEEELAPDQEERSSKDVNFTDVIAMGSQPNNLTSQSVPALDTNKFRRSTSAAILSRSESSSSINSKHKVRSILSSLSRSNINLRSGRIRKSSNPLYVKGYRRDEEVISCAPSADFRNTPDYVCKLARLPYDANCWSHVTTNGNNSWEDTIMTCQRQQNMTGWRRELEQLFKVYEHQCSASWRTSKQLDQPETAGPTSTTGTEDEDRGKKGRSCSSVAKAQHWKDVSPEPRKRAASVRPRKIVNGKHAGGTVADGSLDTSSDSINSFASIKRKGMEKESSLGRPESSLVKQRVKSARGRNSQSPTTFTASSPLPPATTSKKNPSTGDTTPQLMNIKGSVIPPINNITNEGTASEYVSALNNASAPSSVPTQKVTAVDTNSAVRKGSGQLVSPNSKHKDDVATTLPKITVVREVVTTGGRQSSSTSQQVDTNKLWVQNPYENTGNETDEDDDAQN